MEALWRKETGETKSKKECTHTECDVIVIGADMTKRGEFRIILRYEV